MTREQIVKGLDDLVQQLADGDILPVPTDLEPHEWAYVKGVASHAVLMLISNLRSIPPYGGQ